MSEELTPLYQEPGRLDEALQELPTTPEERGDWASLLHQMDAWPMPVILPADTAQLYSVLAAHLSFHVSVRQAIAQRLAYRTPFGALLATTRMQVSILRPAFWLLSLAIMGLGMVLEVSHQAPLQSNGSDLLVRMSGPLLAYLGVTMAFRGFGLRTLEWELACPPSASQLMLARLVIVLGYDICLGCGLSLASLANHAEGFVSVTCDWLMPLFLVAGLALVLSLYFPIPLAATLAYGVWLGILLLSMTSWQGASLVLSPLAEAGWGGIGVLLLGLCVWRCKVGTPHWLAMTTEQR